ncbi:40S ribosomal protein S3 [Thelohanellus kitauei]|uniref:Small ribosomal subunit protein uS3 n=1 Tax=Thelohanellus kitauei TaxID=669202 RepID=A0A0C2J566_THEKT|nr:40S ribosomal protein S3 [Thelohanellus kitauei]
MVVTISKKRLFVKNGLLYSELNSFFKQQLMDDGYVGLEIRPRGTNTDLILMVIRPSDVVGDKGRRIRELQTLVQRKFNYDPDKIRIFVDPVRSRGLSAVGQCENLKIKLAQGVPVRKACYSIVRFIMRSGASGCEVVVSGKIRGQRAKSMKFVDGVMIHAGDAVKENVEFAKNSVLLKQGVLGVKVKINKTPKQRDEATRVPMLPDQIIVHEPKKNDETGEPWVESHEERKRPMPVHSDQAARPAEFGMDAPHSFRPREFGDSGRARPSGHDQTGGQPRYFNRYGDGDQSRPFGRREDGGQVRHYDRREPEDHSRPFGRYEGGAQPSRFTQDERIADQSGASFAPQ